MVAPNVNESCEWCGEQSWTYSCSMCDRRRTKRICPDCSTLWHARGFGQEHLLENRDGVEKKYKEWIAVPLQGIDSDQSAVQEMQCDSVTEAKAQDESIDRTENNSIMEEESADETQHDSIMDEETQDDPMMEDISRDDEETQDDPMMEDISRDETQNDPFVEHNMTDKSQDDPNMVVESKEETQDDTVIETDSRDETQDDPISEGNSREEEDEISVVETDTPIEHEVTPTVQDKHTSTENAVPPQPTQTDESTNFNEVLQKFPTKDKEIVAQLNQYILQAIRTEDAANCVSFGKCSKDDCVNHTKHVSHFKNSTLCSERECQMTSRYAKHMTKCKNDACPFCIRVLQRRYIGASVGYRHLIHEKKLVLTELDRQMKQKRGTVQEKNARSSHKFCLAQVDMLEKRRRSAVADYGAMSKRAREHQLPQLQLPILSFHFFSNNKDHMPDAEKSYLNNIGPDVPIKSEITGKFQPGVILHDHINEILRSKRVSAQNSNRFRDLMKLANQIVDASLCTPPSPSQCLLDCDKLTSHINHYANDNVCSDPLCEQVRHHFIHLTKCKSVGINKSCEYCLRVLERHLLREIEMSEKKLPAAEKDVQQHLVRALKRGLLNLQDEELDRAKDTLKQMHEKLDKWRKRLRRTQKTLSTFPLVDSYSRILPNHFSDNVSTGIS